VACIQPNLSCGGCRAALKTENVGNGVGLLHLNRIFRTFGAGWRGKLDEFDTLKK
jgi:hypothetical protein